MKNYLNKRKYTILLAMVTSICTASFLENEVLAKNADVYEDRAVVVETFEITNVENGEIRGEILTSTDGSTGEGIYLDETYREFDSIKDEIQVGNVISVDYDKEDYDNEIWDNILDITIME